MTDNSVWQEILLPPGNDDSAWEVFHENSKLGKCEHSLKIGRYGHALANQEIRAEVSTFHESLPFEGYPCVALPTSLTPLNLPLAEAITTRVSSPNMAPCPLALENVATLLHYAYGVTRDNKETGFPRSLRTVPSGGALYPLEIFFHSAHIKGLQAGLYHYDPVRRNIQVLRHADETARIGEAMAQPNVNVPRGAALIVFITAVFERTIFKYGDRGYRFVLLEAGHVAQNLNLVSNAMGLGSLNIGGFFDREIDEFLGLDGVTHSTIYMVAIGKPAARPSARPDKA